MAENWTLMWKMKNTDPNPAILKKKKAKIHALTVIQELEKDLNPQV